jgi:hypothetical protein
MTSFDIIDCNHHANLLTLRGVDIESTTSAHDVVFCVALERINSFFDE